MNWTAGYVSEIEYTDGYYRELSPTLLRLACIEAGIAPPPHQDLSYLELGFGQGLSINIHAAACNGRFWGTDFHPAQAANALALARIAGSPVRLLDDSFAELAARPDLPDFDIIALHGIWSWISDENRRVIVDIMRRKLRVGGIVYMSYNCLPGWAPAMPLRHLMHLHSTRAGSGQGGLFGKVEEALAFTKKVIDSGALYFRHNPLMKNRLERIVAQDRNYVAHEYFNEHWAVMPFSDVARRLEDAKLSFATSAHLFDHVDVLNLPSEGIKLLAEIHDPVLRQTVRDYFVANQFRRDIFVKGARPLSALERSEALHAQAFVLTADPKHISMKIQVLTGEAFLQQHIYEPLFEVLVENDYAPKTLGELQDRLAPKAISFEQLVQSMLLLSGEGHAHPVQPDPGSEARARCERLNAKICERARSGGEISFLASPVTGSGIPVGRFQQLFWLALREGRKTAEELAHYVWDLFCGQGESVTKEGRRLESAEESIAELETLAEGFLARGLATLRALGIDRPALAGAKR